MVGLDYEHRKDIGLKYILDLLEPACPYGAKLLKQARFYKPDEKTELERELDNVAVIVSALEKEPDKVNAVRHALSTLKDVSGSIKNCDGGSLTETELFELTAFLLRMKELIPLAEALPGYKDMTGVRFERVDAPLAILDPAGSGRLSFYIEDSRTPELSRLRREKRELEKQLREQGADREEMMAQRLEVANSEERELQSIYAASSDSLRMFLPVLSSNANAAGRLDAVISKAVLARRFSGVRPEIGGDTLSFTGAVNPEIAEALGSDGREFTPITAELPRGATILTGANMGGKSVAVKTIALNCALALMGFFVFCESAAAPVFDCIELINRDFSSATGGLSSFGGEILRFNEAVDRLSRGGLSFIAMDEFARGTNSAEGAAIVRGVVKYLNGKNAVTILATHYDGAAEFASRRYQVRGLRDIDEESGYPKDAAGGVASIANNMDYGLIRVDNDEECPKDAMRICRLLGMKEEILREVTSVKCEV